MRVNPTVSQNRFEAGVCGLLPGPGEEAGNRGLGRHRRGGAGLGDGEGGDGAAVLGGRGEIAFVGEKTGGESPDKRITGSGGINGFHFECRHCEVAVGPGDEHPAVAEGDDHDGHAERAAERVQFGRGEFEERGDGEGAPTGLIEAVEERDEFGLIGNQNIDVLEHRRLELGPEGGGVEDGECTGGATEFEGVGGGREVGFELGDDHAGLGDRLEGEVGLGEAIVGGEGDDDFVLAGIVNENRGGAGGVFRFHGPLGGDAFGPVKGLGLAPEGVVADGPHVERGGTGAAGGNGLIGSLSAGAGTGGAGEGLTGLGKLGAAKAEVLDKTANNDDGGGGLHGVKLGGPGRGDKTARPFVLGEGPFVQSLRWAGKNGVG